MPYFFRMTTKPASPGRRTLTVTAKGQVTLRQAVRTHMGVAPGDRVEVDLLPGGRVELRPSGRRRPLSDLRGALARPGRRVRSLEEIEDAIADGAADAAMPGRGGKGA